MMNRITPNIVQLIFPLDALLGLFPVKECEYHPLANILFAKPFFTFNHSINCISEPSLSLDRY